MKPLKIIFLHVCNLLGLFQISRWITRNKLHILCYHGFQIENECEFRPQLFISREVFKQRLAHLNAWGFQVLSLEEGFQRLCDNTLPARAAVITIDDGFKSTLSVANPLLKEFNLPATVYVTTYYMEKQVPIFNLGVQYVFWNAARLSRDFSKFDEQFDNVIGKTPGNGTAQQVQAIIEHGKTLETEHDRQELLKRLALSLKVDVTPLYQQHLLTLLSAAELRLLRDNGMDVQLHTHRHRFPVDDQDMAGKEIVENRERLSSVLGMVPKHFCYPSGIFSVSQWPWLKQLGVVTATTCLPGLNHSETPRYGLKRFLDSEFIELIEFKAELSGFNEILRGLKKIFFPVGRAKIAPTDN